MRSASVEGVFDGEEKKLITRILLEILTRGSNSWQSVVEQSGIFYQWLISLESISQSFGKLGIN